MTGQCTYVCPTGRCYREAGHVGACIPVTVSPVPNTPGTPRRTIRISDELWDAAQAKAVTRGENLSDVIRKALERYVRRSK